jgi:AraC-like DNA-binding protein
MFPAGLDSDSSSSETGTFNVLLEFLEYDRRSSLKLSATRRREGELSALPEVGWSVNNAARFGVAGMPPAICSAARTILSQVCGRLILSTSASHHGERLAEHCGVSLRTLEKAFTDLRGLTPVAHMRNLRLDHARRALDENDATVAEIAARFGFRSSTTFALEYRKRFGMAPSRTR